MLTAVRWSLARRKGLQDANATIDLIERAWRSWAAPYSIVRGESFNQEALVSLCGKPRRTGYTVPAVARLVREPSNVHDLNAVRVDIQDATVGYVARPIALYLAPMMDDLGCGAFELAALIRGGYSKRQNFGVMLWPTWRLTPAPRLPLPKRSRAPTWPP